MASTLLHEVEEHDDVCTKSQSFNSDNSENQTDLPADLKRELDGFSDDFVVDVTILVRQYIDQFFTDKRLYCGGPIPKFMLHNERSISMVINYDISRGVLRAYKHLEPLLNRDEVKKEVTSDVKLVMETLNMLARSGIPQQFAGGMLLLYLEFVEGVNIGSES